MNAFIRPNHAATNFHISQSLGPIVVISGVHAADKKTTYTARLIHLIGHVLDFLFNRYPKSSTFFLPVPCWASIPWNVRSGNSMVVGPLITPGCQYHMDV
jgi:hypothetical protein